MDTKILSTFLKAAELESFSKVSEELGYAPSTISTHIQHLEEELGYPLFHRVGKRITLTEQGAGFISTAKEVSILLDNARNKYVAPKDTQGVFTIGIIESLISSELIPLLPQQYFVEYPKVSLVVKSAVMKELFHQLRRNELDIVFVLGKKIEEPDCIPVFSKKESLVFVANRKHPLVLQGTSSMEEILKQQLILTEKGSVYRNILEEIALAHRVMLSPHLQTDNTKFIINMLIQGEGISFLPDYVARPYIESGDLGLILTDYKPVPCWRQAFYHKDKWKTPQMEGFISLLQREHP